MLYILAAPDGPRDVFLKAEAAHKANCNLFSWCKEPKNKNKGEDDTHHIRRRSRTHPPRSRSSTIFSTLVGRRRRSTRCFRGCGKITPTDKQLLNTMLSKKDEFGEDTLMALMWRTHFPEAGPTGNKFTMVKENLTAAIEAFKQRTNAAEAQSVATKRALDIATAASASTKRPRLEDEVVEIVDSD